MGSTKYVHSCIMPHSEHSAVPESGVQEFNRLPTRGSLRIHGCTAERLEVAERAPVGQDSSLHLGEGCSDLVILLLSERCGQVLPEPGEMLADDPADLLVARGPVPGVRWRPAGCARHARQRRHAECLVLVREQPGPGSQVGEGLS